MKPSMRSSLGKLLTRQNNRDIRVFYQEGVLSDEPVRATLESYVAAHGRVALRKLLGSSEARVYLSGTSRHVSMEAYIRLASTEEGQREGLDTNRPPDVVTGIYVGRLLALYFDNVDERTRDLADPMDAAKNILLEKIAEDSSKIAGQLQGAKRERHNARQTARDNLAGRRGVIPYTTFDYFENATIAYLAPDISREDFRRAVREADGTVAVQNGRRISPNLEASIEARLKELASQRGGNGMTPLKEAGIKPYWFRGGLTPPRLDYLVNDRVEHPSWGLGTVVASEKGNARKSLGDASAHIEPSHGQYYIDVMFDHRPEGALKLVGQNTVRLMVEPAMA